MAGAVFHFMIHHIAKRMFQVKYSIVLHFVFYGFWLQVLHRELSKKDVSLFWPPFKTRINCYRQSP